MFSIFRRNRIKKYIAEATIAHAGSYADLTVPTSLKPLSDEIINKWVMPYYMWTIRSPEEFKASYSTSREDVTVELCRTLLTSLNWRSRISAAYFSAIEEFDELEDHIGRLFLRSDVCYSGQGYALALAVFNSPLSIDYLKKYLDHYLTRKDLWFEQADAMAALHFTDTLNNTSYFDAYLPLWQSFIEDKPNHDIDKAIKQLDQDVINIESIRTRKQNKSQ